MPKLGSIRVQLPTGWTPVGFTVPFPSPGPRCALTAPFHPYPATAEDVGRGGLLSVALSLGSPPPGVTRHRVSVEPGLSEARPKAAIRPSGRVSVRSPGSSVKAALPETEAQVQERRDLCWSVKTSVERREKPPKPNPTDDGSRSTRIASASSMRGNRTAVAEVASPLSSQPHNTATRGRGPPSDRPRARWPTRP